MTRDDAFAGVAQMLMLGGLPAVVAMQFEIRDTIARDFTRAFYKPLAEGLPVDTAVAEARKEIFTNCEGADWATLVLYLRHEDGRIFDVKPRSGLSKPSGVQAVKVPVTNPPKPVPPVQVARPPEVAPDPRPRPVEPPVFRSSQSDSAPMGLKALWQRTPLWVKIIVIVAVGFLALVILGIMSAINAIDDPSGDF